MRFSQRVTRVVAAGLSSRRERARLDAMVYADAGHGYDVFGMHPDWVKAARAVVAPFYRHYFRVSSHGAEHIPQQDAAILIANHAGTLPIDAGMICLDVLEHTEPPRMPRPIADRFLPRLPFFGTTLNRVGIVHGALGNVRSLLRSGQLCLIFPEGTAAIGKTFSERYRLYDFRVGHAELALREHVKVVPVAVIGSEEQWPVIAHIDSVRPLGLPYVPVPAIPLPLPVHYHIHYGPPIDLSGYAPDGVVTRDAIKRAAEATQASLQALVEAGLQARRGVFR